MKRKRRTKAEMETARAAESMEEAPAESPEPVIEVDLDSIEDAPEEAPIEEPVEEQVEAKADNGVPSVEDCAAKGFSADETDLIIKGCTLMMNGPGYSAESKEPALRITAMRPRGMWRCGRQFTKVATVLPLSQLSEAEIAIFASENPKNFKVEKINH